MRHITYKNTLLPGIIILAGWLFFALYFAVERLYGDSAYYLFQLVNDVRIVIEHDRPSTIFMQIIPYFMVKSIAPLSGIIVWFSFNEWLFYAISFLLLVYVFKDRNSALALLFALVIGSRWNYFNPVSELFTATPFVFMTFSLLRKELKFWIVLLVIILIVFIIYSHPLYFLVIGLLLLLVPFEHIVKHKYKFLMISIGFAGAVAMRYLSLDGYEAESMSGSGGKNISEIIDTLSTYNYSRFIFSMIPAFLGFLVFFIYSIIYRRHFPSRYGYYLYILFTVGYFFLVLYKYGHYFPDTYEPFERYLFLLPLTASLVFFTFVYDKLNFKTGLVIITVLAVYHLSGIFLHGLKVQDRNVQLYRAIDYSYRIPHNKISFRADNYYTRRYGHDWIMANESILMSAANGRLNTRQVFIKEAIEDRIYKELNGAKYLYAPWWQKSISELNVNYFYMSDTLLFEANTDSLQVQLSDSIFKDLKIEMTGRPETKLRKDKLYYFPVLLDNNMKSPLYSGMKADGVSLTIQWVDLDGNDIGHFEKTPILADVYSMIEQEIRFRTPPAPGNYKWRVCLSFDNGRLVPLNEFMGPVNVN